jgi:hypothetical protein
MLDFIHRGFYIGAICFFIAVGFILVLVGDPEYLKPIVSEGLFKSIYGPIEPVASTTTVIVGSVIAMFSTIIGAAGGFICRFSKKDIIPKEIHVLRAQNVSVFLVDGEVYKKAEASFYNLDDLSRVRVTLIRNLYYAELQRDITIAPEGDINEKNTSSDRNSKTEKQGPRSNNEKSDSDRFTV